MKRRRMKRRRSCRKVVSKSCPAAPDHKITIMQLVQIIININNKMVILLFYKLLNKKTYIFVKSLYYTLYFITTPFILFVNLS